MLDAHFVTMKNPSRTYLSPAILLGAMGCTTSSAVFESVPNDGSTSPVVDGASNPSPSGDASPSNDSPASSPSSDGASLMDGSALGDGGVVQALANVQRSDPDSGAAQSALPGAVAANNAFALDLYTQLLSEQGDAGASNILTSPISASLALTMTYAGALGQTATGMASALHFGAAANSIFEGQNALSQALASRASAAFSNAQQLASAADQQAPSQSDYDLTVVNSVWGEQTYPWAAPFLNILAQDYGTGVYLQDFINQFDQARLNINAWVSSETFDKINNLLPEGSLDSATRMVLVNAIHLKLPWQLAFAASATATDTFTRADGTTVSPSFMNQTLTAPYVDDGQAQVVGLPLTGGQVSVLIALPHADVGLAAYESNLTAGSAPLVQPASQTYVRLSLPKATFTSPTFSLKIALQAMGMGQAFDKSSADFSGMCASLPDGGRLYISDVLQKAMVAVQETGVEAAAATAVIMARTSVAIQLPTPTPMVVNRPYLVTIVDVPTGAILFLGHVEDPTDSGSP
jgi:serpin B